MRIWISRLAAAAAAAILTAGGASAQVVTRLPTHDKVVALTFDACESVTPAFLDKRIADIVVARHLPVTLFVAGRFARHNQAALAKLAGTGFVEIENHSMNHYNHMDRLDDARVRREVAQADAVLYGITGRHTRFFRFPAGNYDARTLADVEAMGYRVVHWSFASGDPARSVTPQRLRDWVLSRTRPGSILIFHINGRGWSTADALPGILDTLTARGYRFVRLDALLK